MREDSVKRRDWQRQLKESVPDCWKQQLYRLKRQRAEARERRARAAAEVLRKNAMRVEAARRKDERRENVTAVELH
jgi:hypothetical protein